MALQQFIVLMNLQQKMLPNTVTNISDNMRDQYWANGYLANYKGGIRVIVLPQSFEDETNSVKSNGPLAYAWIIYRW